MLWPLRTWGGHGGLSVVRCGLARMARDRRRCRNDVRRSFPAVLLGVSGERHSSTGSVWYVAGLLRSSTCAGLSCLPSPAWWESLPRAAAEETCSAPASARSLCELHRVVFRGSPGQFGACIRSCRRAACRGRRARDLRACLLYRPAPLPAGVVIHAGTWWQLCVGSSCLSASTCWGLPRATADKASSASA